MPNRSDQESATADPPVPDRGPEQNPEPLPQLPVARVAVDVSLSHLDRPFDYRVPVEFDDQAVPGSRVRVRFAGRLRDGFVLERLAETSVETALAPLHKVVSAEPVLTPEIARLTRAVADHYAGCFADVVRLAVPPRHATTEKATPAARPEPNPIDAQAEPGPFAASPTGAAFLEALQRGDRPRAGWLPVPSSASAGDWARGLATAAAATLRGGRGSVLVVPDQRDLALLAAACTQLLGAGAFVTLTADLGPAARYRAFLAALRGDVSVVIGTRAAAFAPVRRLGLLGLWDDGDDLLAEPRAPYPHAREVLALRAAQQRSAVLFAGYARSCETQRLVDQGWLRDLGVPRPELRRASPRVRVAADTDRALERDPVARQARLPHEVFEVIRAGLSQGPVLVQVPRGGYLLSLACAVCHEPVRCGFCHGPTQTDNAGEVLSCRWCGRLLPGWRCAECGSERWRAPVTGSVRTAEELGRAFPNVAVRRSGGGHVVTELSDEPALVVSTPGAEPRAPGGYAAAVLLDAQLSLLRTDLRAAEEALRRWLNATALVRPGEAGGTVIVVGPPDSRAVQALVRLDPGGFAQRELTDRAEARFPPAVKLITVDGRSEALADVERLLQPPDPTELLGPVDLGPNAAGDVIIQRLTLRTPLSTGPELSAAAKAVAATRSAKKAEGALRIQVDPVAVG